LIIDSSERADSNTEEHTRDATIGGIKKVTADFQCFVCGAVFTTDQDRRQHLEKEAHGLLHEEPTEKEMETARKQEELNESHTHHI
jgi:uncharacterized C2H2 Zn-finger protein